MGLPETENSDVELRPYQSEAAACIERGWEEFRRQLIVLPTGGGKTIVFAHLARWEADRGGKTLVLVHREELLLQARDKIRTATGLIAEVERGRDSARPDAPVVVSTVQTMGRRIDRWPADHFSLVVADEAHHAISSSWRAVLDYFVGARVLGVTATPDRGDKRNLGTFFENIAYEVSLFDLIRQNYLSPIACKAIPVQIDLTGVRKIAGDYSDADLGDAVEPYLRQIARAIREHASFRRTLVFLPLIRTSQSFADICHEEGVDARHVDGGSEERRETLDAFARGEFDVLCNAMLLTEGYDCPEIDCVVILRPTQSRALYSQMVGRGTRVAAGKDNLLLLDFLWLHEKHSLIRPAHLVAANEETANEMTRIAMEAGGEEHDLEELSRDAASAREERLRAELMANARRKSRMIDAVEFSLSLHNVALADYAPTMGWHEKRPSKGQMGMLSSMGFDPESIHDRGHASAIIDCLMTRRKLGLATPRQVKYLRALGHPSPETATFTEASEFLDGRWGGKAA